MRDLAAHHSAHKTHHPLRLAQIVVLNRTDHNQQNLMHFVLNVLRRDLPGQDVPQSARKHSIELLDTSRVSGLDLSDDLAPILGRRAGGLFRFHIRWDSAICEHRGSFR
jgi:hypothetical protein